MFSHDSVDQIILSNITHTINGIDIDVEKTLIGRKSTTNTVENSRPSCIHVFNIPSDVTSEELSNRFSVHVADILLRPANPESAHLVSDNESTAEAWIKHLSNRRSMEDFVKKYSRSVIRGCEIFLDIVEEPFSISELCRDFERGVCGRSADRCFYKHINCDAPDDCDNVKCWFGHSRKRSLSSDKQPIEGETFINNLFHLTELCIF